MDLISPLPATFHLSPFPLGSFCLPSEGAVDGGYCTEDIICNSSQRSLQSAAGYLGAL